MNVGHGKGAEITDNTGSIPESNDPTVIYREDLENPEGFQLMLPLSVAVEGAKVAVAQNFGGLTDVDLFRSTSPSNLRARKLLYGLVCHFVDAQPADLAFWLGYAEPTVVKGIEESRSITKDEGDQLRFGHIQTRFKLLMNLWESAGDPEERLDPNIGPPDTTPEVVVQISEEDKTLIRSSRRGNEDSLDRLHERYSSVIDDELEAMRQDRGQSVVLPAHLNDEASDIFDVIIEEVDLNTKGQNLEDVLRHRLRHVFLERINRLKH